MDCRRRSLVARKILIRIQAAALGFWALESAARGHRQGANRGRVGSVRKTARGDQVFDEFWEISGMKSLVALVGVRSQSLESEVLDALRESLRLIGGIDSVCRSGARVLVKPNIGVPDNLNCTNPAVVLAIARLFVDHGCKVMIGDDPAVPIDEVEAYKIYHLGEIAVKAGAQMVSLRKGPFKLVKVPNSLLFPEIEVSALAMEADLLISAATLKSVNVTTVSLGIKNMKGVMPARWKRSFHCEGLNAGIVDLCKVARPGLTIIDATFGKDMVTKRCYPVGLLVVSKDPLAADSVGSRVMGFEPRSIDHLRIAKEEEIGELDLERIDIRGELLQDHMGLYPFSQPNDPFKLAATSGGKIEIVQGNPCSVCVNELGQALSQYTNYAKGKESVSILVGPKADAKTVPPNRRIVYFGNCLAKHQGDGDAISGCPPNEGLVGITDSIARVLDRIFDRLPS